MRAWLRGGGTERMVQARQTFHLSNQVYVAMTMYPCMDLIRALSDMVIIRKNIWLPIHNLVTITIVKPETDAFS